MRHGDEEKTGKTRRWRKWGDEGEGE